MKLLVFLCVAALGFPAYAAAQETVKADNQGKHPVTVADSIGMNLIADDGYYTGYSLPGPVASFSPDGSKFVVILRRGNLERNSNEYSLLLWRTNKLFQSHTPEKLLSMSSSSNRDAIKEVHWWSDNETLSFLGEQPGELQQLYALNVQTRTLRQLTKHPTNLLAYSITSDGKKIAYTAEEPTKNICDHTAVREGFRVTGELLPDLMSGRKGGERGNPQLFVQAHGKPPHLMKMSNEFLWKNDPPYLSPDGKYLVVAVFLKEVPATWREYSDRLLSDWAKAKVLPGQHSLLKRYVLVDTESRRDSVLLNAPLDVSRNSQVLWFPDNRSVAIAGVYLPLESSEGDERKTRQSTTFSVEIKIPSRKIVQISDEDLTLLRWDSKASHLVFGLGRSTMNQQSAPRVYFRKNRGEWEKTANAATEGNPPEILLEEGINVPPRIFAESHPTGQNIQNILLLDLNPQFKNLNFARVEEIHWKDPDGHDVSGGLYYPLNYLPGKRYPLVIQTHGWNPHRFWIEGAFTSGFAAQTLAGKGIMVLQADENYEGMYTYAGLKREVAALEGAIDNLDARSIIDRNRIGLVGFSLTCLYVKYALTHSQYHFAAASVTDGFDGGYFPYIAFGDGGGSFSQLDEALNGGLPFGEGLKSWEERSPGFNVDKVQTPLRIVALNPASLLGEWEWFAVLRRLAKPVDLIYVHDGEHVLEKPWERMIASEGNVDWFCFWLKGEEDPSRAKAEQYARWHELRNRRETDSAPH